MRRDSFLLILFGGENGKKASSLDSVRSILRHCPVLTFEIDVAPVMPREPHITLEVSLDKFTPHHPTTESPTNDNTDNGMFNADEPSYYTYPCRCSAEFVITVKDLEDGVEVVGCSGCGEWLRVLYEVVEEEMESPVT